MVERTLLHFLRPALALVLAAGGVSELAAQMRAPLPPYPYGRYRLAEPESNLRIAVTPKDADVYVDGYFAGKVDDFDGVFQRLHVRPGEHDIVVYLAGYRPIQERLYLSVNTTRKIEGALERLGPGELNDPPPAPAPDAAARRDPSDPRLPPGRTGLPPRAPLPPGRLPPGLDPDRGGRPPSSSRTGSLVIRVQPADAEVFIDGERWRGPAGDERLVVQVAEGRHQVEVRKDGYVRFLEDVDVRGGDSLPLNVSLAPERRDQSAR